MKAFIEKLFTDKNYYQLLSSNATKTAAHYTKDRAKELVEE